MGTVEAATGNGSISRYRFSGINVPQCVVPQGAALRKKIQSLGALCDHYIFLLGGEKQADERGDTQIVPELLLTSYLMAAWLSYLDREKGCRPLLELFEDCRVH